MELQSLVRFRIPWALFRIPDSGILDSTAKNSPISLLLSSLATRDNRKKGWTDTQSSFHWRRLCPIVTSLLTINFPLDVKKLIGNDRDTFTWD